MIEKLVIGGSPRVGRPRTLEASEFRAETIVSREALDSHGNPTVQVDLDTKNGFGRFSVPSGASKGHLEALELRDGDRQRYNGQWGSESAGEHGEHEHRFWSQDYGTRLKGLGKIGRLLIELDGTDNKSNLGANAILGVSLTLARASAHTANSLLYRTLAD